MLSMLTCPHTLPHILLGLQSLHSCGALKLCLQCHPHPPLCLLAPTACGVPSQHASDTAYHPYTCIVPTQYASDAAYHPYASGVPSRHASNAPLTGLIILMLLQPPQDETTIPPLTILTLPRRPQDMPLTLPSTPLMPNPLSTSYHPYAQVLDPWGTVACWRT
ncbi:hypothetical protein O181_073619 [Austropuccinia psidii MF-1]|uniref:Uncharacterized protein n=1 Tax=Austropuccinia psidii MF-1 TaxID=1389203 RepID=A0A9Q3ICM7_9BASI|nr:hypothetical protein [Austropuccinia psidii MF-1]